MFCTELGIVTEVRLGQPENVFHPILVIEFGIMIEVRPEPLKAQSPILVTEFGIVIEVRAEQYWNAPSPIFFTDLGIVIEVIGKEQKA